jgi:hypothetical protein
MPLRDLAFRAAERGRRIIGLPSRSLDLQVFAIDSAESSRLLAESSSKMGKLFFGHKGRLAHKWIHYLDIYERHFAVYRNTPVRMLEIGVAEGGSLEMWREYFGPDATIFGIDVNPECETLTTPPNQVRIGSQDDPDFLRSVVNEIGTPDIILDDGSHRASHQRVSFDTLFPLLRFGGLYVLEDLHTSYFQGAFEGGYRRKGTAIERVKDAIDDMHAWYHNKPTTTPARDQIGAIHIYDSITVIEKKQNERPSHMRIK